MHLEPSYSSTVVGLVFFTSMIVKVEFKQKHNFIDVFTSESN